MGRDFSPKGTILNAGLLKRLLLQGSAGILPALAPAAMITAPRGRIALPEEDTSSFSPPNNL
jgi:hypothetical protein